ncbi:putative MFS-type transporterc [Vanrija pseudolonga]|uniref:Purtative MFS-type transporterc n=1 Tax=Vanrija pseudolonga TaxID=143232 RepID=A0AAF0Y2T0_9TREE|nr:purtative MFS-type transporterc [Vanrija pseudolonga]
MAPHTAPKPLGTVATLDTTDAETVVPTPTATSVGFGDIELKNKNLAVRGRFDDAATDTATLTTFVAPHLTQGRKWVLLSIFSLAMFIDILGYSAFFVLTESISRDIEILYQQSSWVITSYSVTFAAFLLFWGRVSDLYSSTTVFVGGFTALGTLSLIISFLTDKYSFFVFRALAGIAGGALIPSSYRLITAVFDTEELTLAFTVYGLSGAISNVVGTVITGTLMLSHGQGQLAAWRWFFRVLAIIILPAAALSYYVIPWYPGTEAGDGQARKTKWRRLDLPGALIMCAAIVLLILGLTLGASYGWRKPGFLVPFLLSWPLFVSFFVWENYLGDEALLPPKTWRIPNFIVLIVFALEVYGWWGVNFLPLTEYFITIAHEIPLLAATRTLPQGVIALIVTIVLGTVPVLVSRPRWTIAAGAILSATGYVLMAQPDTYVGKSYWRWLFPCFIIGSGGNMACFSAINVAIMVTSPPEMAGVTGAVLQVSLQVGTAVALSVQAGLLTTHPGSITNPANLRTSWYFQIGWIVLWLIGFLAFYRPDKAPSADAEATTVTPATED